MSTRSVTHDGHDVGSFTIQPDGRLRCSKGHVGASGVYFLTHGASQEMKCQTCNEVGLVFESHGDKPILRPGAR